MDVIVFIACVWRQVFIFTQPFLSSNGPSPACEGPREDDDEDENGPRGRRMCNDVRGVAIITFLSARNSEGKNTFIPVSNKLSGEWYIWLPPHHYRTALPRVCQINGILASACVRVGLYSLQGFCPNGTQRPLRHHHKPTTRTNNAHYIHHTCKTRGIFIEI